MQSWATIVGGSALATFGATRRNWAGAGLAAAGGYLVYRGVRSTRHHVQPIHVERAFTINKPVEEVFQFWRNFENLPRFMRHLQSVQVTGDRKSRWQARAPMGINVTWEAEITDEQSNSYIVWTSLAGATIENRGSVEFRPATFHGGTEVRVAIDYRLPAGRLGAVIARMFGEEPEQQIREDLRHFKQLLEAGEIPTTEGQPSGRRTPWVRMVQAVTAEKRSLIQRTA